MNQNSDNNINSNSDTNLDIFNSLSSVLDTDKVSLQKKLINIESKTIKIVKILPEAVADVNAECIDEFLGLTPLHIACLTGSEECVDLLIEHNANVFIQSQKNHNAEDLAIIGKHFSLALKLNFLQLHIIAFHDASKKNQLKIYMTF